MGKISLLLLCLGAAFLGGVALLDPYGGHGVAGWVWLGFLSIALGVLLGLLTLIRRAFRR